MTEQLITNDDQTSADEINVAMENIPPAGNKTSSLSMIVTLGAVAMMSGLLVVLTWQITLKPIQKNKQEMIENSIFNVIPGAVQRQTYLLEDNGIVLLDENKSTSNATSASNKIENKQEVLTFYAGFDAKGKLKGIAAESAAQGYADKVHLIYGYEPECECIRGFNIIKMAETPGLGDKILTDANFLANFDALDAKVDLNKQALMNPIKAVKQGSKSNPWEVDSISGATITSKAVAKAINLNAQELLPRLRSHIKAIQLPVEANLNIETSLNATSKQEL